MVQRSRRTHSAKPKMIKSQSNGFNARAYASSADEIEPRPVTVLHVDDDPNDTELLRAAARKAGDKFAHALKSLGYEVGAAPK